MGDDGSDLTVGGGRHPRAEAEAMVGDGRAARVLEPSPPAVEGEPWADDPVALDGADADAVVSPLRPGSWAQWAGTDEARRAWAADRWLAAQRRLPAAPPPAYRQTRERLHLLATNVVTPARYRANGKIGLRWTRGGFGTPFFTQDGADTQVRVEGTMLVRQHDGAEMRAPITTLGAAAWFVLGSAEPDTGWVRDLDLHDPPPTAAAEADLTPDAAAAALLGDWFGFATLVLELLRADEASVEASRPQIWPEHFDPAIEVNADRRRGSYGFSPGDASSDGEPYAYATLWYPEDVPSAADPRWNAQGYTGAVLPLSAIGAHDGDQVEMVLAWMRERRDLAAAG